MARSKYCLQVVLTACLSGWSVHAQSVQGVARKYRSLPIEERDSHNVKTLRSHGIDISNASLIEALRNDDAEIRRAAAVLLEEMDVHDAVPFLKDALAVERDTITGPFLASVLLNMGDSTGETYLKSRCLDVSWSVDDKLNAERLLIAGGASDPRCVESLLVSMETYSEPEARSFLVHIIPELYRVATGNQGARMVKILEDQLLSTDTAERFQASISLRWMNSVLSLDALRVALARETDPVFQDSMADDIKYLEDQRSNKQTPPGPARTTSIAPGALPAATLSATPSPPQP